MDKEDKFKDWEIKICPIRNKQCLQTQCAWWLEEDGICAVKRIKPASLSIRK